MLSRSDLSRTASVMAALALTGCAGGRPLDPAKCELEMRTRLDAGYGQAALRSWKDAYLVLVFDKSTGDGDLLDEFLEQRGYFQAANDPNDKSMRDLGYYPPNRDSQYGEKVADQKQSAAIACQASYLTGARLLSINAMAESGSELLFKAELKR